MNSIPASDVAGASTTMSRRMLLRSLAVAPIAAVALSSVRGLSSHSVLAVPPRQAGTPAADATSCPATPGASPVASPEPVVEIKMTDAFRFDPENVVIKVGQTVTWKNPSAFPHTATGDPAQNPVAKSHPEYIELPDGAEPWGSELLQPGDTYSHTFTVPGKYLYICIPHVLTGMRASITVECA